MEKTSEEVFVPKFDSDEEMRRRIPREKWLKERGWQQITGSIFRFRIAVPIYAPTGMEIIHFDYLVGMDVVAMWSFEELEAYDQEIWMKVRQDVAQFWRERGGVAK